ncbi:hypothetical protein [Gluconobacter morbifer]|nr:hypothetical protein [Gluconobacter morbifer]
MGLSSKCTLKGLRYTAIALTTLWTTMIWRDRQSGMNVKERDVHLAAMSITGLLGISGFLRMRRDGWKKTCRPWLGVALITAHGFAGVHSRRALQAGDRKDAIRDGFLQMALATLAGLVFTAASRSGHEK